MNIRTGKMLYLFTCGTHMLRERDIRAAQEIARFLDDADEDVKRVASFFLYRASLAFGQAQA